MIYGLDETPNAIPCTVIDALGHEVQHVIWCDTDTGLYCRHKYEDGKVVLNEDLTTAKVWDTAPAPLRVHPR